MLRSSLSISSNIAEGFGRKSKKDFARFLLIAMGSTEELRSQLRFARDTELIKDTDYTSIHEKLLEIGKRKFSNPSTGWKGKKIIILIY
jgi:four helix bundle protein